jgi:hypothetical protein
LISGNTEQVSWEAAIKITIDDPPIWRDRASAPEFGIKLDDKKVIVLGEPRR